MKYLVTGGLGVIGSRIASRLSSQGHDVVVIDGGRQPRNLWMQDQLRGTIRSGINVDLQDFRELCEVVSEADAVIHAAASTGIPHSVDHPASDWLQNVEGTRALLDALRRHPRPTVVLSSVKPYAVPDPLPPGGMDETALLVPDEPYAASKAAQSMLAMAYARSYGIPVVTFRCSNLYGAAPCHGPRHGWLTWFAISAAIGRPIQVQGGGEQTRDMLHAEDVTTACVAALEHSARLAGEVFNLGGGSLNRISVGRAARALAELGGVPIVSAPARAMDDQHVFVNTSKFLRATGWRPLVGVEEGMRSVFEWARDNRTAIAKLYEGV